MSPLFATRRRAEEFDAVVAGATTPRPTGGEASDDRYDDLLALVGALRAVPQPQPRPEFVAELSSSLVAEAATMPALAASPAT